jgi:methionine sulfoxide reductase heme-binding subunit
MTSNPIVWDAMRASGVVAYVLLTIVVVLGLALSGRVRLPWPRFAVEDVHRFGGLLVGTFLCVHVGAVLLDSYVPFSLGDVAIPFLSSYRPLWTALGIVAAELLLALAVTNRLRRRLPYRLWRNLHRLNLVVWVAATAHGVGSGSDRASVWLVALYLLALGAVGAAALVRLGRAAGVPASTH